MNNIAWVNRMFLRGAVGADGYAAYFLDQYQQGLALLEQRPGQLEGYERACDRLFLQCERKWEERRLWTKVRPNSRAERALTWLNWRNGEERKRTYLLVKNLLMTGAVVYVRPNAVRDGFDIKVRSRLGVNFFTEAAVYDPPNDDDVQDEPEPDQVPIEDPPIVLDNVGHFGDQQVPEVEIIWIDDDEEMPEAVNGF